MKLIKQSHKVWGEVPREPEEALLWIERAGRKCYASEDKIKPGSALPFVRGLVEKGHLSVLEHSSITLNLSAMYHNRAKGCRYLRQSDVFTTGNLRAWMEFFARPAIVFEDWLDSRGYFKQRFDDDPYLRQYVGHMKGYTVEVTTNRAMTHELVRHRPCSFSQQSQRYIRYGDKTPMQFIEPVGWEGWKQYQRDLFFDSCDEAEERYGQLLASGLTPQQARNVLPNATASTIVITADKAEFELIFRLRCDKAADPQMVALMTPIRDEMTALWDNA